MNLDQEKRVMLAFALSIIALLLFRTYFMKQPPAATKKVTPEAATTQPVAPQGSKTPAVSTPAQATTAPVAIPVLQGTTVEDVVVDSPLYRVTFSTQGALVKSWVLKKFRDENHQLLNTVNEAACESLGFPMSLDVSSPDVKAQINRGNYVVQAESGTPASPGHAIDLQTGVPIPVPATLTFSYSDGKVLVKKEFSFNDSYEVQVGVSVRDGRNDLPVDVAWPGGFGDHTLPFATIERYRQGVYGSIGDLTTVAQTKVKEPRNIAGPLQLAGLEDKFFANIFLPDDPNQVGFRLARQDWAPSGWTEKENPNPLAATLVQTQPKTLDFRMFVGPKALEVLRSTNPPLDSLVDFGWFSIVAKPLFIALRYIYDHWIHNYGWAIVILTLLINMAMFPLKIKSLRSAQEMQKVQPILKGIQDKYKNYKFNDPRKQKMNEEIMKVYSEHHINPFGSCLPMLLQMPLLYGFYRVLDLAIELRHAPWIWWMKDLSAPDRLAVLGYHIPILVILMTVASFVLQRMTPMATVDPSQQRMMMFMPVMLAFFFFNLPSGMVLYWLTSSVVQILQQLVINRFMPPPAPLVAAPRKPAEARG